MDITGCEVCTALDSYTDPSLDLGFKADPRTVRKYLQTLRVNLTVVAQLSYYISGTKNMSIKDLLLLIDPSDKVISKLTFLILCHHFCIETKKF